MIRFITLVFALLLTPILARAAKSSAIGIGGLAQNLMSPVTLVSDFMNTGCLLLGVAFLFTALIKYFEHKRSPLMVPVSTIVFFIIAGLVLISIPVISYLTQYGVPYSLFKLK